MLRLKIVRLHPQAILPRYATAHAAGMDLSACLAGSVLVINPGENALVPTGLAFELPVGYEAQLRPRSGLALRSMITLANAPATIDADYRGEVKVILINHGKAPFSVAHGDRIAQMVIAPVVQAVLEEAAVLSESDRGSGGFGHTGIAANEQSSHRND